MSLALERAVAPDRPLRGFDRYLFGSFRGFDQLAPGTKESVFGCSSELPADADLVIGHFAFSTLREAFPRGRLLTILREPVTRVLSHWLYWRQTSDEHLADWAGWSDYVRTARLPLANFLSVTAVAPQVDNVLVRALLWPHALIPEDGFIAPRHDRRLLRLARQRLRVFDFVDVVENERLEGRLAHWLQRPFEIARVNETSTMPPKLRSPLHRELTPDAYERLTACARLDLRLWSEIASRRLRRIDLEHLRARTLASECARYGAMMARSSSVRRQ